MTPQIIVPVAVVVVSIAAAVLYLLHRRRELAAIAYVTSHGIIVRDDGGVVPPRAAFEAEVERTLAAWNSVPAHLWSAARLDGLYVRVRGAPIEIGDGKVYGHYSPGIGVVVWLDGRPLEQTALAEEIGHALHHGETAELQKRYGVP